MPNTLAHIGAQLPITRILFKKTDPRWICLGLLIPDIPWILQRLLLALPPGIQPYEIRAYVVLLSSPVMCALVSGAIAVLFEEKRSIFWTLFLGSLFHLLLDGAQEKGGMGILMLFPFSWKAFSYPVFSMDGWLSLSMTVVGLVVTLTVLIRNPLYPRFSRWTLSAKTITVAALLTLTYALVPALLIDSTIRANVHDTGIISGILNRTGQTIHFDRATYLPGDPPMIKNSTMPQAVEVTDLNLHEKTLVSGTARFVTEDRIDMHDAVIHPQVSTVCRILDWTDRHRCHLASSRDLANQSQWLQFPANPC
jgi:hypothetical protein